jgi:hypothetical protein
MEKGKWFYQHKKAKINGIVTGMAVARHLPPAFLYAN